MPCRACIWAWLAAGRRFVVAAIPAWSLNGVSGVPSPVMAASGSSAAGLQPRLMAHPWLVSRALLCMWCYYGGAVVKKLKLLGCYTIYL